MTEERTVVERFADFAVSLRLEDVPPRVVEKARHQIANVLASLHAGARTEEARAVLRAVRRRGEKGPCTIVPTGERVPLRDAILANGALAMALDYDDYLYMGHTGHSAVLAPLAIAERDGLTAKDVLAAQIVANEIGGRLGASAVLGPQNGQAWSFLHAASAAAAAARLFGLSRNETAHAIAIALYEPPFVLWPGFMGPGSKVLTAAWPTLQGVEAAELAREGLTGARNVVEARRKGFWAAFTFVPLPRMTTGFGKAWVTDTIAFKRYPGCAYVDTTLDALFLALHDAEVVLGRPLAASDVERIDVDASLLTVEMDNLAAENAPEGEGLNPVNVNFSIGANVAIAILAGRHGGRELGRGFLRENEAAIRALADRVHLRHDWALSFEVADAFDGVLGSSSALAQLSPRAIARVVAGYRSQMGGRKKTALGATSLLRLWNRVLARARAAARARRGGRADLAGVDFARFRMTFPANVSIRTTSGRTFAARQDVPWGAPGQTRYLEVVEEKLVAEASERLGEDGARRLMERIRRFEDGTVGDLLNSACGG